MKDVKVDVRVNVGVDSASVVLLLASAAMALFFYKQHKKQGREQGREQVKERGTEQDRLKSTDA